MSNLHCEQLDSRIYSSISRIFLYQNIAQKVRCDLMQNFSEVFPHYLEEDWDRLFEDSDSSDVMYYVIAMNKRC